MDFVFGCGQIFLVAYMATGFFIFFCLLMKNKRELELLATAGVFVFLVFAWPVCLLFHHHRDDDEKEDEERSDFD